LLDQVLLLLMLLLLLLLLLRLHMFLIELLKYIGILLEYSRNSRIWLILEIELDLLLLCPLRPLRLLLLPPWLRPFASDGS
jgi:hypothetical protein